MTGSPVIEIPAGESKNNKIKKLWRKLKAA